MNTIKQLLKRKFQFNSLVALVLVTLFAFSPLVSTVTYAVGGGLGRATEFTQIQNNLELAADVAANTATAASTAAIQGLNLQDFTKEFTLDGIAWAVAKRMVSNMTQDLVNWINSGFSGSPNFITDLDQYLLDALDQTAGAYISSLGDIGEFICSPFRLDVQAALSIKYAQARSGMPSGPTAPSCTLSDVSNNIENFLSGFAENGLSDWFTITSNPQNTPYGAYLEAEAKLQARLINEAGKELQIANWSDGFLSNRICEAIEGTGQQNCVISTPGKVISEALTFQLSTGPRALIEADEINEIIGALMNQLTLQAVSGINGLLGMSGGTGYTDTSGGASYIDRMGSETLSDNITAAIRMAERQLQLETNFMNTSANTMNQAMSYIGVNPPQNASLSVTQLRNSNPQQIANNGNIPNLQRVVNDAYRFGTIAADNVSTLNAHIAAMSNTSVSASVRQEAAMTYMQEATDYSTYHNTTEVDSRLSLWNRALRLADTPRDAVDTRTPAEWFEEELGGVVFPPSTTPASPQSAESDRTSGLGSDR